MGWYGIVWSGDGMGWLGDGMGWSGDGMGWYGMVKCLDHYHNLLGGVIPLVLSDLSVLFLNQFWVSSLVFSVTEQVSKLHCVFTL